MRRDHLRPGLQRDRKCRHHRQRTRAFSSRHRPQTASPRSPRCRSSPYRPSGTANGVLHPRPQHRRRKRQRHILLIVDVIHALRFRIIAMPVRPRVRRILWHLQPKDHSQIVPGLDGNRLRLVGNRAPSLRHFQLQSVDRSAVISSHYENPPRPENPAPAKLSSSRPLLSQASFAGSPSELCARNHRRLQRHIQSVVQRRFRLFAFFFQPRHQIGFRAGTQAALADFALSCFECLQLLPSVDRCSRCVVSPSRHRWLRQSLLAISVNSCRNLRNLRLFHSQSPASPGNSYRFHRRNLSHAHLYRASRALPNPPACKK